MKMYYHFSGNKNDQDERLTLEEVKKHKQYRRLLNFLIKKNGRK